MRKQNILLSLIQFSYLAAFSTFFNFLIIYMGENGYSAVQCGLIQALTAFLLLVVGPVVSYLVDSRIGYKKILSMGLFITTFTVFLVPLTINYFFLGGITIVMHSAMVRQFPTIIDAATLSLRRKIPKVNYGLTRGIGSVGEGLAALIMGYVIARTGFYIMFITHAVLIFIAAVASLFLISEKTTPKPVKSMSLGVVFNTFKHNQLYLHFLLSAVFLNIGMKVISIFSSLIVMNLGGSSENYGVIMFMCGLFELPTFITVTYLASRIPLKYIYLGGVACFVMGATLICVSSSINIFMVGRVLTSMTYAIYISILVEYVSELVPTWLYTTAMSMIVVSAGSLSHIVSSLVGGILVDYFGIFEMLIAMLLLTALTLVSFYPNIKFTKHKEEVTHD